jgi:SAM-dependent methyltransferase
MFKSDEILSRLNLVGPLLQEEYINQVELLGKDGDKFLTAIDLAVQAGFTPDRWKKIYKLKNKNKKLSQIVSSHSYSNNYRAMLDWLQGNYNDKPLSVIELGCENGLFTQCLQLLFTDAEVVGIDVVKDAILIAKKLAHDNRLQSISFYQENLVKPLKLQKKFDLVVAPFFFHEFVDADDSAWHNLLDNLKKITEPDSKIIAFNRFPYDEMTSDFHERMHSVGYQLVNTDTLRVVDEAFPISVFSLKK